MNDLTPPSAPMPPQIPITVPAVPSAQALGDLPEERHPIPNIVAAVEAILRQPRRIMYQLRQPGSGRLIGAMLLMAVLCSLVYGLVVGAFSMGTQLWAAPLKIAGGMLFAALICLPSLYIFA